MDWGVTYIGRAFGQLGLIICFNCLGGSVQVYTMIVTSLGRSPPEEGLTACLGLYSVQKVLLHGRQVSESYDLLNLVFSNEEAASS